MASTASRAGIPSSDAGGRWSGRVLEYLEEHDHDIVADVQELVRIPSISGSDAENEIQAQLARRLASEGLEVDHWRIALGE